MIVFICATRRTKQLDAVDWRVKGKCHQGDLRIRRGVKGILTIVAEIKSLKNGFEIIWKYDISTDPAGKSLGLTAHVPAALLEDIPRKPGNVIKFDSEHKMTVKSGGNDYNFDLSGSDATFSFAGLEDFRHAKWWKDFRFNVVVKPLKKSGKIVLRVTGGVSNSVFICLPIAKYGNRGLADDTPNDGKGGWTDQGTNDLSGFPVGKINAQGVPFEIGNNAIILKSLNRPAFPGKSPIIPIDAKVERLCFFQTSAWCGSKPIPVFNYRVVYSDGTITNVSVIQSKDIVDWWSTTAAPNAKIAWSGNGGQHAAAVYHSQWKNPKPDTAIKSIQVISGNQAAVPIVMGITAVRSDMASPEIVRKLDAEFSTASSGEMLPKEKTDWYRCSLGFLGTTRKGSALDASFLLDAPAGKHGFLKKVGAHFEFENQPGKRAVFWGTNLGSYSTYMDKSIAPLVAKALARHGVNIVRIHLWATLHNNPAHPELIAHNLFRKDGTFDPVRLDEMHFFHAELIKNGIYIYMDTYDGSGAMTRILGKGDPKYQPELNDKLKAIVKTLFTTVNPYTGKSMVDDPAYCMFEIMNENSCTHGGYYAETGKKADPVSAKVNKIISERWETWQKDHGISPYRPLKSAPQNMGPEGRRFFAAQQKNYIDGMKKFLQSIGVKVPICGTNLALTTGDLWASENMDFMNDHTYFGSSSTGVGLWQPRDTNILKTSLTSLPFYGEIVHSRLADKPIVCTEWSFVYPNIYRCEGYPLTAAYTAFQGFDAMFSFDWGGAYTAGYMPWLIKDPRIVCLTQILDPSTFGLNQAAAIAVLRGDVKPARQTVTAKYTVDDVWNNRRQLVNHVSFMYQMCRVNIELLPPGEKTSWPLGTGMDTKELYADAVKRLGVKSGKDFITSDTGEITRFANPGLFLVDSPKSQFATGALNSIGKANRKLSDFEIKSPMKFATLTFTSLDDLPLSKSGRILCCAVGNSANAGSYIDDKGYTETQKGPPVLAEPITATISAKAVPGKPLKVFKLNTETGERNGELQVIQTNRRESFTIDKNSKTMYFELIR